MAYSLSNQIVVDLFSILVLAELREKAEQNDLLRMMEILRTISQPNAGRFLEGLLSILLFSLLIEALRNVQNHIGNLFEVRR